MQVLEFEVTGKKSVIGVLGSGVVYETAKIAISDPVFPEVTEQGNRRILKREGALYPLINQNLARVGGHDIQVSSVKSSTEIEISYIVSYDEW